MKPGKRGLYGLGVILLVAVTALANKVTADYDHKADFSKYKTFSWMRPPRTTDPLMKDRIVGFINDELQRRNLRLVDSNGDLSIAAHTATKEEKSLDVFYNGFGGWRWHAGFGGGETAMVETYEVGTLVVDLFDTSTKQVIWRGVATDTISDKPEKNTKELQKAVEEMFKKYPGVKHTGN